MLPLDQFCGVHRSMSDKSRRFLLAITPLAMTGAAAPPKKLPPVSEAIGTDHQIVKTLQSIQTTLQMANEPKALERECDPEKPDRASDLCAQWRAADAAADSADWTERSFWLALAGLIIGTATLIAAGAAAWFAKGATVEAKRGASAAENAVAETKRIGEAQARAYVDFRVHLVKCDFDATPSPTVELTFGYINTGQTPAKDFRQWITFDSVDVDDSISVPLIQNAPGKGASKVDIGSGQDNFHKKVHYITAQDAIAIKLGRKAYVVCGIASYLDVFGKSHTLRFRRRLYKPAGFDRFVATNSDNTST